MNFNQTQRVVSALLLLLALSAPLSSYAVQSDYELLVQRNLELREKIGGLERKYTELENERNVLIGHVRNLQQEREGLLGAQRDVKADKRYQDLEAAFDEVSKQIGAATEGRDRLARELDQARKMQEDSQTAAKRLESENAGLLTQITQARGISEQQKSRTLEQNKLASEKQALEKQLKAAKDLARRYDQVDQEFESARRDFRAKEDVLKTMEERIAVSEKAWGTERASFQAKEAEFKKAEEDNAGIRKQRSIELAFYKAREADLAQKYRALLSEYDQLKADVQRLTKVNAALKDTEQKLQQARQDLDAARAGLRKIEAKNRKIENKLARMNVLKTRSRKNEEDLKALQMLQKEHEAMIRKLTSEKTALEVRLARIEAPAGVSPAAQARRKGVLSPANKQKLDMHFNLAVAYDKTKMYKAEEREYLECLRLDPNDANVHYNLGILYDDKLKDDAKAIKHYQKYLRLRPMGEDSEQVKEWIMHAEQQQRL